MYARQPPRPLQIPKNYRGTAFSSEEDQKKSSASDEGSDHPTEEPRETEDATVAASLKPRPPLFGPLRMPASLRQGIGSEELLLLGLILLVSQDRESDDLLLLLLLLLFLG